MERSLIDIDNHHKYFINHKVRTAIAFIASVYIIIEGQEESIVEILRMKNFYVSFLFSFAISRLLIELIHIMTKFLDKKCKWEKYPFPRLVLQILFGIILILYLDILLVKTFFYLVNNDFEESGYMLVEFPKVKWMVFLLNFLYWLNNLYPDLFATYPFFKFKHTEELIENLDEKIVNETNEPSLQGKLGRRIKLIPISEIACLKCESESGFIYLKNGQHYNMDYKVEELLDILDSKLFFQTNRGIIFAFDVVEYHRPENKEGFLILKAEIELDVTKIISRTRYKAFKESFDAYLKNC